MRKDPPDSDRRIRVGHRASGKVDPLFCQAATIEPPFCYIKVYIVTTHVVLLGRLFIPHSCAVPLTR